MKNTKQALEKVKKYIKGQSFSGAYAYLKKNIINYIDEMIKEEK